MTPDVKALADGPQHRWSGWPGAWCLDCGAEDPYEIALADGRIDTDGEKLWFTDPAEEAECQAALICPEPGSKRHDPYHRAELARRKETPDAE